MAALAAYPELSTKKEPHFVNPGSKFSEWYGNGTFKMLIENTLNPVDENVYTFIDKVMTEVASLFPFEYIHMGGDESYHGYWEADKKVQAFMKTNKIKDSHGMQSYFVGRVSKIVNAKQKKLIGWDEILEGGLVEGAAVMSWRGVKGGIEAAKKGHSVVMSPTTHAYLDYMQGDASVENTIYSSLNLAKTYSFEPVPEGIEAKYILGTQGNLWSEVIPSLSFAFYMTYPRAFAIAENGWTAPNLKNYDNFLTRVENHIGRFETQGISIAKTIFEPEIFVKKEGSKNIISLKTDIKNAEIYYSVDNTYPVNFSKKYIGPFEKPEGNYSLRTQVYRNGKALGRELIIAAADLDKRAK
jgi:hexosaminidase